MNISLVPVAVEENIGDLPAGDNQELWVSHNSIYRLQIRFISPCVGDAGARCGLLLWSSLEKPARMSGARLTLRDFPREETVATPNLWLRNKKGL